MTETLEQLAHRIGRDNQGHVTEIVVTVNSHGRNRHGVSYWPGNLNDEQLAPGPVGGNTIARDGATLHDTMNRAAPTGWIRQPGGYDDGENLVVHFRN